MCCFLGVNSLFAKTGCDRSAIDDLLDAQEGVSDQNLLQYLGIVEARANQLLLTRAFIIKRQVTTVEPTSDLFQILYLLLLNANQFYDMCSPVILLMCFLRRNPKYCPKQSKEVAYFAMVRSTLEYSSGVWDPLEDERGVCR